MPRRYEKEIEEIIARDERRTVRNERVGHALRRINRLRSSLSLSSGNLILIGLLLFIAGMILSSLFLLLASVGSLALIAGFVTYYTRSRSPMYEKRWSGEVVCYEDSWRNRFRRFFNRPR